MKWHLTLLGLLPALATAQEGESSRKRRRSDQVDRQGQWAWKQLGTLTESSDSSYSLASSSTSSSTPLAIASSTSSTSEATTAASSTTTTSSAVSSASSLSSSTVTASPSIVTVALDGSGQFSVIGSAISYAQSHSYPTVTVKAGTYSESITIAAAATVTIVGEAGASNSYADNAVTISNSVAAPLTISSTAIKGITFRNINFYNSNAASSAGAVSIKGLQHAFYACQFVTAGSGAVTGGNAVALIADSYMEALDKAVYAYPSLYIYNTVLTVTRSGGLMTYTQGYTYNTILYNSTTVFDSCSVVQKTGYTNSFYLFAANQNGSVAVYRNSTMGSYIAPSVSSSSTSSVASSTASSIASSTTSSASSTATVATTAVYTVAPTPTGSQYGSVMSAVAALPADGKPYTISILAGTYTEQVWVNRTGLGKVTLVGETDFPNDFTQNQVTIQFSMGVSTSANSDEITPVINWKRTDGSGLALYNIDFINTYAPSSSTAALAADFYGTNMAAYGCSFKGYQDTLLANQGVQVFSNCYIEGSVDFIWGYSKAYFHQCYIASNTAGACITAQNRPSSTWAGGYVFDSCYVTYTSSYGTTTGTTYLGRPWSQYAVVVYKNSYLDKHIAAAGWKIWSTSSPQTDNVLFGEYNNSGPGAWSSSRASFATNLTDSAAQAYNLESFIGSTSWLDSTAYNYVPSYPLGSSTTPTTTTSPTSSATAVATWAHPTDGTTPPAGAVLVSVGGVEAGSYSNLTIALASLPADSSTQIIFMYPGTYTEQVPAINRAGPVMIIGYTTASPGSSYADNTVTVTYAHGLSVSPLPTGHSDAETATVSTASTKISFYNVNIVNSANLDGSLSSYVTLASSIYGDQIGFYGCSFIGWQDTLLTGNKAGYQYYESCYIEGAIDFIWGYSKAYFKGCTIGAKRAGSAITAQSRASSSAIGGYIFDQCLFTEAPDATVDLTQQVYLGRPYSSYALVVVKNSYLDSIIAPSGWKIWGTSSPNTDHITFAEYNNAGPGNWENNTAARVAWQNCTLLTSDTYPLATVMGSTDWIDMTYWNSIVTPSPAPAAPAAPAASAAPYDGTVPPAGAFIVSKTAIDGVTTYDTVQSALNALPTSSKTTATVFIYPGVYEEQLVLNKSGTTIFMGYSTASDDYSKNQVTISYNEGIDTGSDASNSDSATVYATGNYFQAININFKNTFGTTEDYASLGFAVKSSKYAGLYGCQVYGNQDALLINGYLFAYNTYVEGNVDMIWGAGAAYFLNSTISPNEDKVSLTADKRTDNTTAAGFVFDQCTVTPAAGASFSQISLGRPWNSYARVAFIESYLGSCVEAAGWNAWSSSDPRTSGAMFGEFANYGPGASTSGRASFATQLTATDAAQFQLANFFASTSWINMTLVHTTPFTAANVPTVTSSAVPSVTTVTAVSISTVRANLKVTTTALPVTVTQATTTTLSVGTTITPAATTDIETAKSTSTVTTTSSGTDKTVTSVSTVLVNDAVTVTPALATVTSTVKSTITATSVVTVTAKATTVKSSTTVTSIITSTPKATTVTVSQGTSITVTATVTPGTKKVTSSTTVTAGTGGTTTTTAKATTTTVSVTTTTTSTAKATTSAPASGTVTVTVVSYTTTFTATGTTTIPGSTTTTLTQVTKTTGKTTTLKPVTVTDTTVSVVLKTVGTTIPGTTATTTVVTTKTTGKATTLKASTTTVYTTSLATATAKATVTAPGVVTTSVETVTSKATTTLPAQTVTVVKSADTTIKTTVTLATPTSTVWKTATVTLKPSVTVTSQSTVTKTTTVKVKTTVTSVVATKTKAGAVACSAV
ncbi:family 8 carbohydrate esterase [Cryphonectria parasitica EP155]|uniref:pectinesterase n=1 Tax=Cryphonectria parasitica (strain ATCC 38755 / EP155) TaxID=660469 RepID=A0A9P5CGX1_CRYP1|nr:family 8 carbohydrate esterase [Cryphonectria parasitica EP155]KAF3759889.1 family 8 carbohydrate esterase [Cryphonectria parasitica EP155]